MVFFQEMRRLSQISMTNKVKEHIGFDCLLAKMQLCTLIQLKLYIFLKTKDKSVTHNIIRIQSDDSIICAFYCTVLIENMIEEKIFSYQLQKKGQDNI